MEDEAGGWQCGMCGKAVNSIVLTLGGGADIVVVFFFSSRRRHTR